MQGLLNRGLQNYVCTIFDDQVWEDVCVRAGLSHFNFEAMLRYEDEETRKVVEATAQVLDRSTDEVLEDFGTFVVTEKDHGIIRRLLRFGGKDFPSFLRSLEDVHSLLSVALPDHNVPSFELERMQDTTYSLHVHFPKPGFGAVLLGLLRAMADDYGALVFIEHKPMRDGDAALDCFEIAVLEEGWPEIAETAAGAAGRRMG